MDDNLNKMDMKYFFILFLLLIIAGSVISGCVDQKSPDILTPPTEMRANEKITCTTQTLPPYHFPMRSGLQENLIIYDETKEPAFISTAIGTPAGQVIVHAWANDSAISIPLVRLNESESIVIWFDRSDVVISPSPKDPEQDRVEEQKIIDSLPDENEASRLVKKDLEPFGGVPHDAGPINFRKNIGSDRTALYSIAQYSRSINGLPVASYSSFPDGDLIMIDLGEDGELVSLYEKWRDVDYIQNVEVIPISEALNRLQKGQYAHKITEKDGYNTIHLGYYHNPKISDIPEPVWIFSGKNRWGGDAECYVYAAKEGPVSATISRTLAQPQSSVYDNNALLRNSSPKRPVSGEEAIEIVKRFSGNPQSKVVFEKTEHYTGGCGGYSYDEYILSGEDAVFGIYPDTGEIMSVRYPQAASGSLTQSINVSQALAVSQEYLAGKFSNFKKYPTAFAFRIHEKPDEFDIWYERSENDVGVEVVVSKKSGQVLSYSDDSMIEHYLC